jgi:hypothetical protein
LNDPGFDWRVLVIGGRAVTAMRRVSAHWVHNVAQGARCEPAPLDEPASPRWPKTPRGTLADGLRRHRHPARARPAAAAGARGQRRCGLAGAAARDAVQHRRAHWSTTCSTAACRQPGAAVSGAQV